MNWYIGQRIVVINKHISHPFSIGDEFIIKGITTQCKCGVLIDIGIKDNLPIRHYAICQDCDSIVPDDGIWWISERRFAPIEEAYDSIVNQANEIIKNTELIPN